MICNLILTVLTSLLTIYIIVFWVINHKTEKTENTGLIRNSFLRILGIVVGVQTVSLFILKMDYSAVYGLANRYTIYHICLLAAMIILTALINGRGPFGRNKNN